MERIEIPEELKQLRNANIRLNMLMVQVEKLKRELYTIMGIDYDREHVQGGEGKDLGDKYGDYDEARQLYLEEAKRLNQERCEVIEKIAHMEDELHKLILEQRYVFANSWHNIRKTCKYSKSHVARLHKLAIEEYLANNKR